MLHDLRLYQTELEMQNDELREAYQKLEVSRRKYLGLFDLAPVGYVTLNQAGIIQDINLVACQLLGVSRQYIVAGKTPLIGLLGGACHAVLFECLRRLSRESGPITVELVSSGLHSPARVLEATAQAHGGDAIEGVFLFCLVDVTVRRQIEEQSRNRLQAMENSPASIVITNRKAEIEYVNPKFLQATGYTREEVVGQNPRVLKSGETPPDYYQVLWETLLAGKTWQGEFHNRRKNGSVFWELASISPMRNEQGETTHYVAVKEDITERKIAEQRLKHFSRRAFLLLQLPLLAEQHDESAFFQSVMDFCEELTGSVVAFIHIVNDDQTTIELMSWSRSTLAHYCRAAFDRHYPIEKAGIWARAFHTRMPVVINDYATAENRRGLPEGHTALTRMISLPVMEGDKVRMLVGVGNKPSPYEAIDVETIQLLANEAWRIVEHRRAERALKQSEELLEETGQAGGVGGWEVNLLTREVRWTKQTYRMLDVPMDYRPDLDSGLAFYDPESQPVLLQALEEAERCGKSFDLELKCTTASGRKLWVRVIGQARFEQGRAVKLLGAFQDITPRKTAEQERIHLSAQLAQAQKMESIGLLAGGIAHEFNNKLQAILGFTELAADSVGWDSPMAMELREIQRAARQSAELTRQLLAYASKQLVSPQRLHLGQTIKAMLRVIKQVLGENIEVSCRIDHNLWPVRIDPNQVDQILTNLALNARDAMQGRGRLDIYVTNEVVGPDTAWLPRDQTPGDFACLAVRDQGTGIPAEIIDHIFEPFFTTKPQGKGTGLGLPTVYGITRQNGGFVRVESENGNGTTMRIFLPRDTSAHQAEKIDAMAEPVPLGGKETILVVEDEPAILKLVITRLTNFGYQVLSATDAVEAMAVAKSHPHVIHLLLTDVMMPGDNGVELYRRLHARYPRLAVLYMSGHAADTLGRQGVVEDHVDFLSKPFSVQLLGERVRAMLDRAHGAD